MYQFYCLKIVCWHWKHWILQLTNKTVLCDGNSYYLYMSKCQKYKIKYVVLYNGIHVYSIMNGDFIKRLISVALFGLRIKCRLTIVFSSMLIFAVVSHWLPGWRWHPFVLLCSYGHLFPAAEETAHSPCLPGPLGGWTIVSFQILVFSTASGKGLMYVIIERTAHVTYLCLKFSHIYDTVSFRQIHKCDSKICSHFTAKDVITFLVKEKW